ncbi:LOW QUALITY PROTEIN: A-kinase anchor protein 3 [Chlamydotis macqueenii]
MRAGSNLSPLRAQEQPTGGGGGGGEGVRLRRAVCCNAHACRGNTARSVSPVPRVGGAGRRQVGRSPSGEGRRGRAGDSPSAGVGLLPYRPRRAPRAPAWSRAAGSRSLSRRSGWWAGAKVARGGREGWAVSSVAGCDAQPRPDWARTLEFIDSQLWKALLRYSCLQEFFLEMLRKITVFQTFAGTKRLIQESDPLKILSWFQKNPERCALSIEDVLKSIRVMEVQDNDLLRGRASNRAVYHQENSAVSMLEEVSFYADRLSDLVIAVAHKQINEKSDGLDACFAVLRKPSHKSVELEKEKCHQKHFGQDELANNLSKEILIYANNVLSVMVVSVMKTMEGQPNDSNIACIVLNLLLRHSKSMVSDLIDSWMKNLHDIADELLTNSDFDFSMKLAPFMLDSRKAAEIAPAMLNYLHSALIVQKPGAGRLVYASAKTGSGTDAKAHMRFAAKRTEILQKKKREMTCADAVGNHTIKQGFTLWHENQNQHSQEDSSSAQFIGSLVDTMVKLSLVRVKYSNPESLLAEPGSREDGAGSVGSEGMGTADSMDGSSKGIVGGHRVVVVNQNPSENVYSSSEHFRSG